MGYVCVLMPAGKHALAEHQIFLSLHTLFPSPSPSHSSTVIDVSHYAQLLTCALNSGLLCLHNYFKRQLSHIARKRTNTHIPHYMTKKE